MLSKKARRGWYFDECPGNHCDPSGGYYDGFDQKEPTDALRRHEHEWKLHNDMIQRYDMQIRDSIPGTTRTGNNKAILKMYEIVSTRNMQGFHLEPDEVILAPGER